MNKIKSITSQNSSGELDDTEPGPNTFKNEAALEMLEKSDKRKDLRLKELKQQLESVRSEKEELNGRIRSLGVCCHSCSLRGGKAPTSKLSGDKSVLWQESRPRSKSSRPQYSPNSLLSFEVDAGIGKPYEVVKGKIPSLKDVDMYQS
eukprot:CAMPEP_0196582538 /NCGR_PEP_ID=MMETSP1081-20130531/39400_1 /TAXON_ID=36882 /ORGANISM="Pyramimonas amylifera, Strain CCMP720" /LENGTH=147 /DNA_ID=CAMNT_0041903137 /DNA_START=274 /DNA_END=717 /DNA_ORIENTATION=-